MDGPEEVREITREIRAILEKVCRQGIKGIVQGSEKEMRKWIRLYLVAALVALVCFVLNSCASYTRVTRNEKGQITEIESRGNVDTTVKEGDNEWSQSTKGEPFIKLPDIKVGNAR